MTTRSRIASGIAFVVSGTVLLATACKKDATPVGVTRRQVADTLFVSSPANGVEGPVTVKEVLRIDGTSFDGRVATGTFGSDGMIWLFDEAGPSGARILLFDSLGVRRTQAGRQGRGPGEYQAPLRMFQLADGSMLAKEMSTTRAVRFDKAGNVIATIDLPVEVATGWVVNPDTAGGWFITAGFEANTPMRIGRFGYMHFNSSGQVVDTVHPPSHILQEPTPDGIAPGRVRTAGRDGSVLTTIPGPNRLLRFMEGGAVHVFEWPGAPPAYGDVERVDIQAVEDKMSGLLGKSKAPLPERKQPAHRIFTDRSGNIWLQLSAPGHRIPDEEFPPGEDPLRMKWRDLERWASFESNGALRFIVDLPSNVRVFDRDSNRLLAISSDADGVEHVVVLRIVGNPNR